MKISASEKRRIIASHWQMSAPFWRGFAPRWDFWRQASVLISSPGFCHAGDP